VADRFLAVAPALLVAGARRRLAAVLWGAAGLTYGVLISEGLSAEASVLGVAVPLGAAAFGSAALLRRGYPLRKCDASA
jgi:hypothetical protein